MKFNTFLRFSCVELVFASRNAQHTLVFRQWKMSFGGAARIWTGVKRAQLENPFCLLA